MADRVFGEIEEHGVEDIDRILADLHALRRAIADAWQARALTMNREERHRLRDEIHATCEMLITLTASD